MKKNDFQQDRSGNTKDLETRHLDEYELSLLRQFFDILKRWDREARAKKCSPLDPVREDRHAGKLLVCKLSFRELVQCLDYADHLSGDFGLMHSVNNRLWCHCDPQRVL